MSDTTARQTKRFYRLLLRLLPAEFRGDYGPEMEQVFAEQRKEAARAGDKMSIWRLWWETAKGIFTTAPREHLSMLRQDSRRIGLGDLRGVAGQKFAPRLVVERRQERA